MELNKKDVGERFKAFRLFMEKKQTAIANDAGISQSSITRIEGGELYPSVELLFALHSNYKLNVHWMLTGEKEMFVTDEKLTREELICKCFDMDKQLVLEMIETMEKSPMVKHSVLGFFTQFKYRNKKHIAMDMEINTSSEKEE